MIANADVDRIGDRAVALERALQGCIDQGDSEAALRVIRDYWDFRVTVSRRYKDLGMVLQLEQHRSALLWMYEQAFGPASSLH
ncbi:hypothetical protein [Ferrimonas marina]|uniref:Uncharacterized protein n=1 Tax=Ferrimonas marina TaxID=299255 RepID=A0A1M5TWQ3_9GAMM|nr:hypothetical protein [Ferrimonas marina]SHH55128.1 hypothetical protein SAMN02745129_2306 [Ferrimonas marina]